MSRWKLTLLLCLFLTACSKEVVEETTEYTPKHQLLEQCEWDGHTLCSITPVTSFELQGDALIIYPYNDDDRHITMERFFISDYNFWETTSEPYRATDNYKVVSDGMLYTDSVGVTHAIKPAGAGVVYHLYGNLPSGYFVKVVEQL